MDIDTYNIKAEEFLLSSVINYNCLFSQILNHPDQYIDSRGDNKRNCHMVGRKIKP